MKQTWWGWLLLVVALCGWQAGCGSSSPDQLQAQAQAAAQAAEQHRQQQDPKAARNSARQALEAAEQLERLAAKGQAAPELAGAARLSADTALIQAETAEQEHQRRSLTTGLKVAAYRQGRQLVLGALLGELAGCAAKAGQNGGTNSLTGLERSLAEESWRLVQLAGRRPALADGSPDWAGAAADLRVWSKHPPAEVSAVLVLALVTIGRSDFALVELESIAQSANGSDRDRAYCHGGRALVYIAQGWDHLAASEAEAFSQLALNTDGSLDGRLLVALVHAARAVEALQARELVKADAEIAAGLRAWPNNPLLVFLTGERLAADGQWEKAAVSLEAQAAGESDAWMAERLAQRARELRDGKGNTRALVLDARFLVSFLTQCVLQKNRETPAVQKLLAGADLARSLGTQLARQLHLAPEQTP